MDLVNHADRWLKSELKVGTVLPFFNPGGPDRPLRIALGPQDWKRDPKPN
jgi:hypothetical protein